MFGIGYVDVTLIPCSCYVCLRKLSSPFNRRHNNYNQDIYKGENQQHVYYPILGSYNKWSIINCIDSKKQNEATKPDIDVHTNHNYIREISLNIGRDISDNDYGKISTTDKNAYSGYYLVKCTSDSYNFQYSNKLRKYYIKDVELVCDTVYLNPMANLKQWYMFIHQIPRRNDPVMHFPLPK